MMDNKRRTALDFKEDDLQIGIKIRHRYLRGTDFVTVKPKDERLFTK
ncbi:hypothetical protein [Parablautia muri]|nr:hypothetical protein [Parablautia muri]